MRELLAHRLSPVSSNEAKREWYEIVEGDHDLWRGVSEPYKHTIRAFLVHFNTEIQRSSTERFNFRNGSVGATRGACWLRNTGRALPEPRPATLAWPATLRAPSLPPVACSLRSSGLPCSRLGA